MAPIAPFALDPAGPDGLDRFTAYWYATILDAVYRPGTFDRLPLYTIAGAATVQQFGLGASPFPAGDVSSFGAGRAVVALRGTTTNTELLYQLAGLLPVAVAPWGGLVAAFWAAAAAAAGALVAPILQDLGATSVALAGHSYGGAVAALLPDWFLDQGAALTDCLCTIGAPRAGSLSFAQTQAYRHLRLTNHGDPVPMLPPSFNPTLDRFDWILAPPAVAAFWHVGTRCHLFTDGSTAFPPEQSTWANAEDALIAAATQLDSWFVDHEPEEYARRLRIGIAAPFGVASVEFPGIEVLDQYWGASALVPPADQWLEPVYCASQ